MLTYLPLGVSQTAAAAVAIIGIALVMLARGVLRGQRRSWLIAVGLLAVSTVLHLVHAVALGAIVISAGVLVLLLVERRFFTATTDRSSLTSAAPALVLIVVVAVLAAFIGVEVSNLHRGSLPAWPSVLAAVSERLVGLSTLALPRPDRRLRVPDDAHRRDLRAHQRASTSSPGPWSTGAWLRTSAPPSAEAPSDAPGTSSAATGGARSTTSPFATTSSSSSTATP